MRGTILELRTANPRKTARLLRDAMPGASVGLFGDRVHLVTEEPDRVKAVVEEVLKKEGVEVRGIRQVEPSLEDVFVSVLGREDTKA
jgi:ABC-2 type transport system ATP-binding protein